MRNLVIVNIAIGAHPTQGNASFIFLARRPFERSVVIVIVGIVEPLAEPG